jgi:predicted nucleic acid-binding protein
VKPVLLDTGVIVALLDRSEKHHGVCAEIVAGLEQPLITCEAVIAESCYLVRNLRGASEAILENIAAGIFQIPFELVREADAVRRILQKYRDRRISLADACLIHLANAVGAGEILTLDGDFEIYRWGKNKAFQRMPC